MSPPHIFMALHSLWVDIATRQNVVTSVGVYLTETEQ